MKYLVTGAGQVGSEIAGQLIARGHTVVQLTRSGSGVQEPGVERIAGDAGDPAILERAAAGASAIFHCIHTAYSATAFRRDLPARERAVMDIAASRDIPVVFPESVYAYGAVDGPFREGMPLAATSGKGLVRKELLESRIAAPARTVSVVASDFLGPTAVTSVADMLIRPATSGRPVFSIGSKALAHSFTFIPDLANAMIYAADHVAALAPSGTAMLHAPTADAHSQNDLALFAAHAVGRKRPLVISVPISVFKGAGIAISSLREVAAMHHLWDRESILAPGLLAGPEHGLVATAWKDAVARTARAIIEKCAVGPCALTHTKMTF